MSSSGVVVMEIGLRQLRGRVSHFFRGSCSGEMQEFTSEGVNINQMTDLERKSVEEASIGRLLGDRKNSTFSRQRTRSFLG